MTVQPLDKKGKPQEPRSLKYNGDYPEPGAFFYLYSVLSDIGMISLLGGKVSPITWNEIKAFIELTDTKLTAYEVKIINKLSKAYVDQYNKSLDITCESPFKTEIFEEDPESECDKHKNFLRQLTFKKQVK